ncbi:uncharacterized protein PV09_02156 [Verruconis gallopava]|uniref:NAD(P)-binding protein n=1 Tax=Verruconis gallopava TaxID=253628 RepID=A0A0D1XWX2_9PEZI|nr:uncharacterized protein PV09_02156 [Verruconis gallopava]KIW07306.1 hypothetical protein PV09_02156 [Verruconis gallopava]
MATVLIAGAASGLGKSFLNFFLQQSNVESIIAIDRNAVVDVTDSRLETYLVDISSPESIENFAKVIGGTPIHLAIQSAGIRGLVPSVENEYPDEVARAETLEVMDMATMAKAFQINAIGTFLLIRAILKNLKLASKDGARAKVVVMGSRMGSVSYNTAGGGYAYRASKAALNAIMKSFSIDVPDVIFTTLHPGRVETGLVKCREAGAIEADESIEDMMKVIDNLTNADSGRFYDRFGQDIGW